MVKFLFITISADGDDFAMPKPVIQFEAVSKKYRQRRGRSIRDLFLQLGQPNKATSYQPFWALRDVSFTIERGETVGLIGSNGAGKSTALKLMSGVSKASSGLVKVNGRVGALLELGAGFHPELSGRDNIYFNAALLGMGRREIQRKFDGIVDFSELEDFIDTPVKHYSSGMFMRLAFAVNIHVEPDILLVDEVLAVGDSAFQRKCLDRIGELKRHGVTIFLVSHAHHQVRTSCERALWLDHGTLIADGPSEVVVQKYINKSMIESSNTLSPKSSSNTWRSGTLRAEIKQVQILNAVNVAQAIFQTGETLIIEMEYEPHESIPKPVFGLAIHRHDGLHVCGPNTGFTDLIMPNLTQSGRIRYIIRNLPLLNGLFYVTVSFHNAAGTEMYDYHDRAYSFRVINSIEGPMQEQYGLVTLQGQWVFDNK